MSSESNAEGSKKVVYEKFPECLSGVVRIETEDTILANLNEI